jgi:CDP-diacylglycerol--glycerol-3-phosphate 3-phosphatidyltransferase
VQFPEKSGFAGGCKICYGERMKASRLFNLPNCLTLARIFAMPVVVALLYCEGRISCFLATLFFVLASVTDLLDGHIARKENLVTSFGKFLDPLADKVLVCSVCIMLTQLDRVPAWITILIVCRELIVTGLRAVAADEGVVIAADTYGKLKTFFQSLALVPLILHYPLPGGFDIRPVGEFLLYIALALTLFSGGKYIFSYCRTGGKA